MNLLLGLEPVRLTVSLKAQQHGGNLAGYNKLIEKTVDAYDVAYPLFCIYLQSKLQCIKMLEKQNLAM